MRKKNLSSGYQGEKDNRFAPNLWSTSLTGQRACVVSNNAGRDSSELRSDASWKLHGAKHQTQWWGRIDTDGEQGGLEGLEYYCIGWFGKLLWMKNMVGLKVLHENIPFPFICNNCKINKSILLNSNRFCVQIPKNISLQLVASTQISTN